MPIYHVKTPTSEHVVDAATKAAAVNHVVRETITAENLTASDLVYLMQQGLKVETARAETADKVAASPEAQPVKAA